MVKPVGITSSDTVLRIKKIINHGLLRSSLEFMASRLVKVGHGGTLDMGASGVLVIGVGADCKKLSQFLKSEKCYVFEGELGKATNTYDSFGTVTEEGPWQHIARSDIERALSTHFTGTISQVPPVYSALKHKGKRLSDLAEKGIIITPPTRSVTIHSIHLTDLDLPSFRLSMCCSSGTYVRSIVNDLGRALGSVAHMKDLCRTRQAMFTLESALVEERWTFDDIMKAIKENIDHL